MVSVHVGFTMCYNTWFMCEVRVMAVVLSVCLSMLVATSVDCRLKQVLDNFKIFTVAFGEKSLLECSCLHHLLTTCLSHIQIISPPTSNTWVLFFHINSFLSTYLLTYMLR